jgi:hypothetical protein
LLMIMPPYLFYYHLYHSENWKKEKAK